MTLLQARTTRVLLCVVVFFVASGLATVINIPMMNPSFEDLTGVTFTNCVNGCEFSVGPIPDWTNSPGTVGLFQPGTQAPFDNTTIFNSVPDGITTAYSSGGTISQTVGTVQEGEIYTLMVDLGNRKDLGFGASADLMVGGTVIPAIGTTPSSGNWSTFTATFTGTAANVGNDITIQLIPTGTQANFDNVRLTESPIPEPSSMLLLGSGVLILVQGFRRKLM